MDERKESHAPCNVSYKTSIIEEPFSMAIGFPPRELATAQTHSAMMTLQSFQAALPLL